MVVKRQGSGQLRRINYNIKAPDHLSVAILEYRGNTLDRPITLRAMFELHG